MPESDKQVVAEYKERMDLAWSEFHEANFDQAQLLCDALIVDYPEELSPNYLLGHIFMEKNNYNEAIKQFYLSLNKDSLNNAGGFIHYYMGEIYDKYDSKKGSIYNPDKAKEHYIKAKEYISFPESVFHRLLYIYKNYHLRIEFLVEGITKFPDSLELHLHLANAYDYVGDKEKQIETLLNCSDKEFKSSTIYFEIAKYYYKKANMI